MTELILTIPLSHINYARYSVHINLLRARWLTLVGVFGSLCFLIICSAYPPAGKGVLFNDANLFLIIDAIYGFFCLLIFIVLSLLVSKDHNDDTSSSSTFLYVLFYVILLIILVFPTFLANFTMLGLSKDTALAFIALVYSMIFFLSRTVIILIHIYTFSLNIFMLVQFTETYKTSIIYLLFSIFIMFSLSIYLSLFLQSERHRGFLNFISVLKKGKLSLDFLKKSYKFTAREIEITILLLEGHSYRVIAENLFVSEHTVKAHIRNIYHKSGTSGKMGLLNLCKSANNE